MPPTAAGTTKPDWRDLVAAKLQAQRKELEPFLIPPERLPPAEQRDVLGFFDEDRNQDLLTHLERRMTEEADAAKMLAATRWGEWKCVDLVRAYIKRATIIHQLTNTITEPLFTAALARAACLDSLPPRDRRPLHGLPVTLKDQFNVPHTDSTIGYVSLIGNAPTLTTSALVQIMEDLGAVMIAKTNLPQSILWAETENNIFGRTNNPRDRTCTPGGSSGGEAVNLVMKGAVVGWGTDIGGSVRIPGHLTGVYALKPSTTRLPYQDVTNSTEGQEHVPSVIGPMARSLSTLTTITGAIVCASPWLLDPKCTPVPWRNELWFETRNTNLVIGIMRDDGVVRVHPPIRRVLEEAAAKLQAAGHEVVDWAPEGHVEALEVMNELYLVDGCEDIRRAVEESGEPFIPHVQRNLISRSRGKAVSVYEYWQLNKRKWAVQKRYLDRWNASGGLSKEGKAVDLLLAPVMPHVAVRHGGCGWVGYTQIWNVLDYSVGVVPNVGFVDKGVDVREEWEGRNAADRENWALYDPEGMHGHPVGLQVVGRRLEEEKVLAGMAVLEAVLGGRAADHEEAIPVIL